MMFGARAAAGLAVARWTASEIAMIVRVGWGGAAAFPSVLVRSAGRSDGC
jgi:hypothetical protein